MRKRGLFYSLLGCSAMMFAVACGDDTDPPVTPDTQVQDDMAVDDMGVDAMLPDTMQPDTATVDMPTADMPTADMPTADMPMGDMPTADMPMGDMPTADMASPDAAVVSGNGTCAKAAAITLVAGVGLVAGDTTGNTDEFAAGVKCSRFTTSTTIMDGPQSYFKFAGKAGQLYRITTTTTTHTSYTYVFSSSTCTAAAINTDCQSDGATGIFSSSVYSDDPEPIYYKAATAGDVYVAIDSTSSTTDGPFVLMIEEIATPINTKCSTAQSLTFTSGKAKVSGDLSPVFAPDEFATLNCSSSTTLDGPNVYYKFPATAGKAYKMKLTSKTIGAIYMYYFTTTACTESLIETDCQSGGTSGDGYVYAGYGSSNTLAYIPTVSGTVTVGIDYSTNGTHGQFELEIDEVTAPTNVKCSAPQAVTLTGGKAVIKGDTAWATDEFSGLNCQTVGYTSPSSTTYDGAQLYYSWATTKDQWYKFILNPKSTSQYLYVFTSTACTEAAIETDCQSAGASGYALGSVTTNQSEALYWKAPTTGTAYFAVDSTGSSGEFEVNLEEFTLPTNGKCASPKTITLTGGKGSVMGDISPDITPDEFATLQCGTSTSAFDGPQAYYSVSLKANQPYSISVTATAGDDLYAYLFTDTCTEATIQTNCKSGGVSGAVTSSYANPGQTESFIFTPTTAGTYKIAVDTKSPYYFGEFKLEVVKFVPAANDTCANAQVVTLTAGKAKVTGSKKADASNALNKCGTQTVGASDLFFKFTPTTGKKYKITFTPVGGGRYGVWDGNHNCVASALETACGVLGSTFTTTSDSKTITATSGDIYFVADGISGYDIYDFTFDIEELP